ncbi:MAG: RHS repeat-associated core domain-containing protein [Verrucomicrobiales bacterium]
MGRRSVVTRPDGKQVSYDYWPTGENRKVEGAGTYTASYAYTAQGRLQTLTTAAGDTHWEYDAAGNLARKVYLDGTDVDYAYTPGGKLLQRTTERGIVTLYQYNSAGQLERVDYSDDKTAPVVYGYNRLGQNSSVVNGDSTTINEYNADGALLRQSISGGPLDGVTLEQSFNENGQREQFTASLPHNQSIAHHYGYDDKGRMQTVRQDDRQATYTYDDETGALTTTRFETAGEAIAETTRAFDDLGRLTSISTRSLKEGGDFYQLFDYTYNATNQRTRVAMADGSYWEYRYDDLGQVISAKKYWRDGNPVAGQQFEYAFDGIGTRETAKYGGDTKGENLSEITYTKGEKDRTQIGSIEHPGITYVTGKANEGAEVEVTAASATAQPEIDRQGEYFSAPLTVENTNGASVETITIAASEGDQSDTTSRRAFIPARETQYLYDPDGNLLYDGRWHYEWDGENRLITMRAATEAVRGSRPKELQFAYDYLGRRISKRVEENIDGKPTVAVDQRFVYDGWNLVAELDTTGRAFRMHLWGIDLSGSTQGAGGVGGLISTSVSGSDTRTEYLSYDGNGNVTGELDAASGKLIATASFDASGNVAGREFESATPFGFSTKYADGEGGFLYYGFRYLDTSNGRWLSRDPVGEKGGLNLYCVLGNALISQVDNLGLSVAVRGAAALDYEYQIEETWEENGEILSLRNRVRGWVITATAEGHTSDKRSFNGTKQIRDVN